MDIKASNPLRLNQHDVARLPRRYLFLLLTLYIAAGLTWRDLWRQEAGSFGIMLTMAQGGVSDWIYPNVAGLYSTTFGPLPYWIGAVFIRLFSFIMSPFNSAQFAIACQGALSAYLLWLGVYRLGKRDELQPQRLAFGGEPSPTDYGRMLADSAVLLLVATYGVAAHTHDTSEGATVLLVCMMWLCGAISALERPAKGRWLWSLGFAGMGLTLPFTLFIFFIFTTLGVLFFTHWRENSLHVTPVVIAIGLLTPAIWFFNMAQNPEFFLNWRSNQHFTPLSADNVTFFGRNFFVFTWPIAPLGLWCIWRWRSRWSNPMMVLGVLLLLTPLGHLIISGQRFDASMLMFVPGFVLLAPFGLATLNRGRANIIDWFSLLTFSTLLLLVWMFWIAAWTGFPTQLTRNIFKLAPNFQMEFKWWPFSIAVLVSLGWLLILNWRARFQPRALWKAVALSSSGLVMIWVLLATLIMPWLNYTRSYSEAGKALTSNIPSEVSCVRAIDLPANIRGAMYYYANVPFVPERSEFAKVNCPYVLTQESTLKLNTPIKNTSSVQLHNQTWKVIWTGERVSERGNALILLRQ
ncbi:ArnT family glycosyltransferase [Hydromonas duriensis]|nr:hypothetical protein [Hydromonas duriensis]